MIRRGSNPPPPTTVKPSPPPNPPAVGGGECEHRHEVVVNRPSAATSSGIGCLATGGRCVPGTTADCPKATPPADSEQRAQWRLTEAQGKDIRSIKVGEILTQDQWDAVCAFVREGDGVVEACQERIAELEEALRERPAQVEAVGKIRKLSDCGPIVSWYGSYPKVGSLLYTTTPPAVDVALLRESVLSEILYGAHECDPTRIANSARELFDAILAQQQGDK